MLQNFIVVGTQVGILFILIGTGFFAGKVNILKKEGIGVINDVMLLIVTPCVIIEAFQRDFNAQMFKNLMLSILAAVISHMICFLLGFLLIHNKDEARQRVMRFAAIFCNCGFMALPLLEALYGMEGVFYGAGYLAIFNLLVWSVGQFMIAKGQADFDVKKAILNPGVISVIIGFIFFVTSFKLPTLILSPISYLADLNTPLPMLIIGYTISTLDLKGIFRIKEEIMTLCIRLIIGPLILLAVLYLLGYRGVLLCSAIVSSSTPVAAISTMFSIKYGVDEKLAAKLVAVSTLFSIVTMTLIVGFAEYIA